MISFVFDLGNPGFSFARDTLRVRATSLAICSQAQVRVSRPTKAQTRSKTYPYASSPVTILQQPVNLVGAR